MSLIPHRFFNRSMFDMDFWDRPRPDFGISTLDLFDPFDELDQMFARNFSWLDRPSFLDNMLPRMPRVPEKYRIKVDCRGYNAESIKTELSNDKKKLIVTGSVNENNNEDDYNRREFKKTYTLPENVETDKMVSFLTSSGHLIIETPLRNEKLEKNKEDYFPRIIDGDNGDKQVEMSVIVPKNVDPSKIKVTCKDRDLIIQAEDKVEKPDGISQFQYYRRTTLPENTDFESLQCHLNDNKLSLKANLNMNYKNSYRTIPIEMKNGSKAIKN